MSKKYCAVAKTPYKNHGKVVLVSFAQRQIWKSFLELHLFNDVPFGYDLKDIEKFKGADIVELDIVLAEFEEFKKNLLLK